MHNITMNCRTKSNEQIKEQLKLVEFLKIAIYE